MSCPSFVYYTVRHPAWEFLLISFGLVFRAFVNFIYNRSQMDRGGFAVFIDFLSRERHSDFTRIRNTGCVLEPPLYQVNIIPCVIICYIATTQCESVGGMEYFV